jgi:DNA-binding transcriptional LysR family regulator
MNQGPDFRHFVAFVTVAEELNFGKAALRLHITQPTLSAQIKQLEDWHGERLFRRVPHGAELTELGRGFLVWARQILNMRGDAMMSTSRKHSPVKWPFRFGFSPFLNHHLVREAIKAYREIVPERGVESAIHCTAQLMEMLEDGRLDAALVTFPIFHTNLFEHDICTDRLLVCLRKDDPLAQGIEIPRSVLGDRLKILFHRDYHPLLFDQLLKRFKAAGVNLRPTETICAPSEMQFLVQSSDCFGLVREGVSLDPELTALPIEGMNLRVRTGFVCNSEQQTPVLQMLARRMSQLCNEVSGHARRKPNGRVTGVNGTGIEKTG